MAAVGEAMDSERSCEPVDELPTTNTLVWLFTVTEVTLLALTEIAPRDGLVAETKRPNDGSKTAGTMAGRFSTDAGPMLWTGVRARMSKVA